MRITLNGNLGSGKSTVGKLLSERLKIPYISTGQLFREIGAISNMDALRTNLAAENNTTIDFAVDNRIKALNASGEDFVVDSRMAWHFVENATKVFLSVCPDTAVQRVMTDQARTNETYPNFDSAKQSLNERRASEVRRYKALYGVNIEDLKNYDLVVITDDADIEDTVSLIVHFALRRTQHKFWIPKSRLVPMISIREASGISFTSKTEIEESFSLPLYVRENFGFFFEGAASLVKAFFYPISIIPYHQTKPKFLAGKDIMKVARQTIGLSDVYDWEEISGIKFAFSRCLDSDSP